MNLLPAISNVVSDDRRMALPDCMRLCAQTASIRICRLAAPFRSSNQAA